MKTISIFLSLILAFFTLQVSAQTETSALQLHTFRKQLGAERVHVEIYAPSSEQAQKLSRTLFKQLSQRDQALKDLQAQLTRQFKSHIQLKNEEVQLFERLKYYCEASDHAFDFTDYPLREAWGFVESSLSYQVPDAEALKKALSRVNCNDFHVEKLPPSLQWKNSSSQISWQLFRQGWLLESVIDELNQQNVAAASIQIDTLAYYHGMPPGAKAWKVPIPHPRESQKLSTYLYLKNQALARIGDYQDYFMHNGLRYSSILDSRTGKPNPETVAVFVASSSPLEAELITQVVARLEQNQIPGFLAKAQASAVYKIIEHNGILVAQRYP